MAGGLLSALAGGLSTRGELARERISNRLTQGREAAIENLRANNKAKENAQRFNYEMKQLEAEAGYRREEAATRRGHEWALQGQGRRDRLDALDYEHNLARQRGAEEHEQETLRARLEGKHIQPGDDGYQYEMGPDGKLRKILREETVVDEAFVNERDPRAGILGDAEKDIAKTERTEWVHAKAPTTTKGTKSADVQLIELAQRNFFKGDAEAARKWYESIEGRSETDRRFAWMELWNNSPLAKEITEMYGAEAARIEGERQYHWGEGRPVFTSPGQLQAEMEGGFTGKAYDAVTGKEIEVKPEHLKIMQNNAAAAKAEAERAAKIEKALTSAPPTPNPHADTTELKKPGPDARWVDDRTAVDLGDGREAVYGRKNGKVFFIEIRPKGYWRAMEYIGKKFQPAPGSPSEVEGQMTVQP